MKKAVVILTSVLALGFSSLAHAAAAPGMGYMLGFKSADFDIDGGSTSSQPGLMLGVISVLEMGMGQLRTGAYYAERKGEYTSDAVAGTDYDIAVSYVDVPVTVLFNMNDYFGVFAGGVAAIKVADDCEVSGGGSCSLTDVSTLHLAATVGLRSVFGPNWAGEVAYEVGLSDVAEDIGVNAISLNAQFLY